MNLRTKILIDRMAGKPLALGLNLCARFLGRVLRRDHSLSRPFRVIAVSKFVGMGSIIQLTSLLRTLRANYPGARIVFVTAAGNETLISRFDLVDEVAAVDDGNVGTLLLSTARVLFRLWRLRVGLYLDIEIFSNFSGLISTLSCARNRIGFFKSSFQYRSGLYNHLLYFNTKAPVNQVFLQMARLIGCKTLIPDLAPLRLEAAEMASVARILGEGVGPTPREYIVVNPNASDLRSERRWPPAHFARLLKRLRQSLPDFHLYIVGAPSERDYTAGILRTAALGKDSGTTDLSGRLTLPELFALIKGARLVLSNDTGPMHVAFSFGIPAVTLWGPGFPGQYGDFPNNHPLYKNLYCSPCIYEFDLPPCRGDNRCMQAITVDEVFEAVRQALCSGPAAKDPVPSRVIYTREPDGDPLGLVSRD